MKDGPNILEIYEKWSNTITESMARAGDSTIETLKDVLVSMATGSNIYTKLYEIWLALSTAIQKRASDTEAYDLLLDPSAYKQVLDRVFVFTDPGKVLMLYDQWMKAVMSANASATGFLEPWTKAWEESSKSVPQFVQGHPEAFLKILHNLFSAFDGTFGRVFHVPAVGKDREKIEFALRGLDDVTVYTVKTIHYQHMLYGTGMNAFEKVVRTFARRISEGGELKSFDDFLNTWVDVNEKEFLGMFKTAEFARAQSEMMEAALNVKRNFNKQMELYLYDLPVALRSETKDLYKTVYELKRRVRQMERELEKYKTREEATA
jgi:hypothetical protein